MSAQSCCMDQRHEKQVQRQAVSQEALKEDVSEELSKFVRIKGYLILRSPNEQAPSMKLKGVDGIW
uniref:Uncharacterized protein n=1 Tax=Arion vulgaris TaxID=1028688 RepID=A0A0B6ZQF7_9EUPU